ncbi:polyhydroxyalkanoate depolymerase, intracellular [Rhodomicrobium vannielii ATCC 17100]|uniref:Polyhydroxyalkanoate depolymerase, intracellular n=1 Tax=Rhodomicrobium vannielii (strain ATCC 17100 / DSM 162 / LMG 4299 / NCIMB 10020 / ATH 3.1.1) TaxID=648757 RepID=E3I2C1_RHOVT|nr:polyhydroxyalkanoate depolymerase [Rhodomicrobium vannielii]ADP70205.1 polyhydroxyalkanoate depolymerase, intracellular [Rhodomicrobium vannielii ATCC 17100]
MLYQAYQFYTNATAPARSFAQFGLNAIAPFAAQLNGNGGTIRQYAAACELISRSTLTHTRPPYGIKSVRVDNRDVAVTEEPLAKTPFGTLLRFRKDIDVAQPRVLVVAPLSGHFATLLRNTVETLLQDHDVCITDWHNARDVPLSAGRFGFEDYIDHLIQWMRVIGPGGHVVAVCQPCVQVLAAVAIMAQSGDPAKPRSMTLMAGPIDTRINPTKVNELATEKPMSWFESKLISRVPYPHPGAGRRVYPGFVQLTAFMSMNMERHKKAHLDLYKHLAEGEVEKAQSIKTFYDEYFAVLDLTAEFYLETVAWVFQEARLARGELTYRGEKVDPGAIRRTMLLTVEGERDDICAIGQTTAAHDLCTGLRPHMKRHHLQAGVGHYGVFSGRRWESQVYPQVRNTILAMD